ncbi:MAG: LAGLIDADG family homing endonuclease [Methanobacteriota archaeon]
MKYRKVVFHVENKEKIGEFIGLIAGDGGISFYQKKRNYKIRLYLSASQPRLLVRAVLLFIELFEIYPRVYDHRKRKSSEKFYSVEIESKRVFRFIQEYLKWGLGRRCRTISLKHETEWYLPDFLRGFVRGLVESDGWVSHKQVGFTSVSPALVVNFCQALEILDYGFSVRCNQDKRENRAPLYHVIVRSFHDFLKDVKPIK